MEDGGADEQALADQPGVALAPPDAPGQHQQADGRQGDEGVGRLGHGQRDQPEQRVQPALGRLDEGRDQAEDPGQADQDGGPPADAAQAGA